MLVGAIEVAPLMCRRVMQFAVCVPWKMSCRLRVCDAGDGCGNTRYQHTVRVRDHCGLPLWIAHL